MDLTGRTALVTGASSGLGTVFAHRLAELGADLVVTARRTDRLEKLAAEIGERTGRTVTVLAADLAEPGGATSLAAEVAARGLTVDVLVNNAGFATSGRFADVDPARHEREITLDVAVPVALTHAFLPGMLERRWGAVVNVASTAAFQPAPSLAVYAAAKAFVLSFSRALWHETRRTGVRVVAVCPGATSTEFFDVAGSAMSAMRRRTPEQVVATTLAHLERPGAGPSVVDGRLNAVGAVAAARLLPVRVVMAVVERAVGRG